MGAEILEGKGVIVKRPDKEYLLNIRKGKYSYEELITLAEKYDKQIFPTLYNNSTLQSSVNKQLYVTIIKKILL